MKAKTLVLIAMLLVGLAMIGGCQSGYARSDEMTQMNRIEWQQANGTPYVLEGSNVHNAEAYAAPLPYAAQSPDGTRRP